MTIPRLSLNILFWAIVLVTLTGAGVCTVASLSAENQIYFALFALLFLSILAPIIAFLHRPAFRAGGLMLCAIFLLSLLVLPLSFAEVISSNFFLAWLEVAILLGIPGAAGLFFLAKPWGRWCALVMPCISVIAGAMALSGSMASSDVSQGAAQAGFLLMIFGMAIGALLINVGRDRRYFRWAGIIFALAAIILGCIGIWKQQNWNDIYHFTSHFVGIPAVTLAMINLLLMTRSGGLTYICKWIAIAATALCGAAMEAFNIASFLVNNNLPHFDNLDHWMLRACDAALFLVIGATLCLLTARELLRLKSPPTSPAGISALRLTCPVCHTDQDLDLARPVCHRCLLRFNLQFFEPHCPDCDHLLLNLTSDRCPECGRPIHRPPPQKTISLSPELA